MTTSEQTASEVVLFHSPILSSALTRRLALRPQEASKPLPRTEVVVDWRSRIETQGFNPPTSPVHGHAPEIQNTLRDKRPQPEMQWDADER